MTILKCFCLKQEELGDFLGNLMIAPYPSQPRQPNFHQSSSHSEIVVRKPIKVERKRKLMEMSGNKTTDESIVVRPKKGNHHIIVFYVNCTIKFLFFVKIIETY